MFGRNESFFSTSVAGFVGKTLSAFLIAGYLIFSPTSVEARPKHGFAKAKHQTTTRVVKPKKHSGKKKSARMTRRQFLEQSLKELQDMREADERRFNSAEFKAAMGESSEPVAQAPLSSAPPPQEKPRKLPRPAQELIKPKPAEDVWDPNFLLNTFDSYSAVMDPYKNAFNPDDLFPYNHAFPGGAHIIAGGLFGASRDGGKRKHIGTDVAMKPGTPFHPLHGGEVSERSIGGIGTFPVVTYSPYFYTEYLHGRSVSDVVGSTTTTQDVVGHVATKDRLSSGTNVHCHGYLTINGQKTPLNLAFIDWVGFHKAEKDLGRKLTAEEILKLYHPRPTHDRSTIRRFIAVVTHGAHALQTALENKTPPQGRIAKSRKAMKYCRALNKTFSL